MGEKAENIKRIMSSYLRMVGGRISWLSNILHFRNEDDTAYKGIAAGKAELDSIELKDAARVNGLTIKPSPTTDDYEITLPASQPNVGDVLRVTTPTGDTEWSDQITTLGTPFMEEMDLFYGQLTYPLLFAPDMTKPIQVMVNGIEIDFTVLANTITITTYSAGEIDNSDKLRIYYYK